MANVLGIQKFTAAGRSGGEPYVSVCAYKIPQRITAAAILSGTGLLDNPDVSKDMWWLNKFGARVGRYIPWPLWRVLIWIFFHQGRDEPKVVMDRIADSRLSGDAALMALPEVREVCIQSQVEAFHHGIRGYAWETRLLFRPWGFHLEDIPILVHLWHGIDDRETPISMGCYAASKIPNCRAKFCKGEGHMLLFPHWEEILTSLTS